MADPRRRRGRRIERDIRFDVDLVARKGNSLDEHTIRTELEGNLCRCTGYHNIVKAIAAGAQAMGGQPVQAAAE